MSAAKKHGGLIGCSLAGSASATIFQVAQASIFLGELFLQATCGYEASYKYLLFMLLASKTSICVDSTETFLYMKLLYVESFQVHDDIPVGLSKKALPLHLVPHPALQS